MDINRRRRTTVQIAATPTGQMAGAQNQIKTVKLEGNLGKNVLMALIQNIEEASSQTTQEVGFDDKLEALDLLARASIIDTGRPPCNDVDERFRGHTTPK